MGGQRIEKKEKGKLPLVPIGLCLLVGIYLALCGWVQVNGKVMPNVFFHSDYSDLSNADRAQAAEWIGNALNTEESTEVVAVAGSDGFVENLPLSLVEFDVDANVDAVMAEGRSFFPANGINYLMHLFGKETVVKADYMTITDQGKAEIEAMLDRADKSLDIYPEDEGYNLDLENGVLTLTKGYTAQRVDREAAMAALEEAFRSAPVLGANVQLTVNEQPPITPDFDKIYGETHAQMVEPVYDKTTGTVSDHVVGVDFDVNALKQAYERAPEGGVVAVPLTVTQPKDTKVSFESKLFRDLLGSGTSTVSGTSNRKTNVKLSAAACNGVILLPGEEFSYNNTTGSRSADKGYLPAGVYVGGVSMDEVGGGICQTSSTIYYAVLHTALEIVERHDHKFAVGYVPDGMDATVYYGSLDFRFKNSTNYPIKVVTESYDSGGVRKLTVKIYGTNEDGRYGIPERTQFEWVEPTKAYQADETVPQGTLVLDTKQNAYTGRKAQTFRYIYEKDGTLVEKQDLGVSKYDMRPHLYHYNPLDGDPATWPDGVPPKPQVTPAPEPVPEPGVTDPAVDTPVTPAPEVGTETAPVEQPVGGEGQTA